MPSRKRSVDNMVDDDGAEASLLHRIRNMWQFANLCQWIYIFGKAAKISESIDIEEVETECLKPNSTVLDDIALAILKIASSHRGLTHDMFDDQTRKLYLAKSAERNPFGDDELPLRFHDFDVFTKIRVMQQLSQWAMIHPERIREKMDEQRDQEQTSWRIEPYGWDSDDRIYFVLDDNRLYRLTEPPPQIQPAKKKKKPRNFRSGRRLSKRRRLNAPVHDEAPDDVDDVERGDVDEVDDGLGGMKWECIAITLAEVQDFLAGLRKTRDDNEKVLRHQITGHLVPILEKQEEARKRRELQRERELLNLAKMANAKRSSRIANKVEQQKLDEKAKEEERQLLEAEAARHREEKIRLRREQERDFRMHSREQRLKERDARRIQHEEELAQLSEDGKNMDAKSGRFSERRIQSEIERNQLALRQLEEEEEEWVFDCSCGLHGQVDDGGHSVACERCNVWQHSKCLGISEEAAESREFHFVCSSCLRREEEAKSRSRPMIKLKVNRPGSSDTDASNLQGRATGFGLPPPEPSPSMQPANPSIDHVSSASEPGPALAIDPTRQNAMNAGAQPLGHKEPPLPTRDHEQQGPRGTIQATTTPQGAATGGSPTAFDMQSPKTTADSAPVFPSSTPQVKQTTESPRPVNAVHRTTPQLSNDMHYQTPIHNGHATFQMGISPVKRSPQIPPSMPNANGRKVGSATTVIPPVATLAPSPREPILTPPTKMADPTKSFERPQDLPKAPGFFGEFTHSSPPSR